ncbi:MAG TPA: ATP-binding protein [Gemmatimonadales bacterium]|nr:ATP-binding protein [Gemmatimonadales bacterium]
MAGSRLRIALLVLIVGAVVLTSTLGLSTLSAVRAYVGGEGLWSKGQKEATRALHRYAESKDQRDFDAYIREIAIPIGDHQARIALQGPNPDPTVVRTGFIEGRNDSSDVDAMATLFRRFAHFRYMRQAIAIWTEGDSYIARLQGLGDSLHTAIASGQAGRAQITALLAQVDTADARLRPLEDEFSATLGAAARWTQNVIATVIGLTSLLLVVAGVVFLMREQTRRRLLEEELRQSQKLEAIGQLAGGIAHDLNNILTVVLGNADLLARTGPGHEDERRALLGELRDGGRRAAEMVRKLLAFGRRESITLRPVTPKSVVDELSSFLRRILPETIDIQVQEDSHVPPIRADAVALGQILVNLATNARDAMPEGGRFTIGIGRRTLPPGHKQPPELPPGDYVIITASDTGRGMDEQVRKRIFEPFFTTKPPGQGTGLGLAMVLGLMRQHGGDVSMESESGRGSTFTLWFPPTAELPKRETPAPASAIAGSAAGTILLAEDEPSVRRVAEHALELAGYVVLTAENGKEALEILRQRGREIDLVVTDVIMPVMGGRELYAEARAAGFTDVTFLFTSGYTSPGGAGKEFHLTPDMHFLRKPWTLNELLDQVAALMLAQPVNPTQPPAPTPQRSSRPPA